MPFDIVNGVLPYKVLHQICTKIALVFTACSARQNEICSAALCYYVTDRIIHQHNRCAQQSTADDIGNPMYA